MKKCAAIVIFAVLFAGMCVINDRATATVFESQPSWYFINKASYKKILHILGVGFGFRALAADVEYVNFLQYYGDRTHDADRHKQLYSYIDNITDADPHFTFAYTYGSAILAFNLDRHDEAIRIINKGLSYNPEMWQLRLYLGAILYRDRNNVKEYVRLLEEALRFKDHPAMLERILGNIYETYKTPDDAAEYWAKIYRVTKDKYTKKFAYSRIMSMLSGRTIKDPARIMREMEP